ncbi:MAG: hypothetical protein Q4B09_08930 [Lachnospiraceae bacterium]|nr:hypothetical protein [Lachnospiraceae bacterium]
MTANEKIIALVKPEYMAKIPRLIRGHATKGTCNLIAREFPEAYAEAEKEGELSAEAKEALTIIVNDIFEERMKKHNML